MIPREIDLKTHNILNIIGGIAIFCAVFIWLWLGTIGLVLSIYSYELNHEIGTFVGVAIGFVIGAFVMKTGMGILRREQWSRNALMVFWAVVASWIIIYNIFHTEGMISNPGDGLFWLGISVIGILHVNFLRSDKVKQQFTK